VKYIRGIQSQKKWRRRPNWLYSVYGST